MNKFDIINDLAKEKNLTLSDAEKIVTTIVDEIVNILVIRGRAEFRGFGIFFIKDRKKRTARNPKTAELINVSARSFPKFKISKYFFEKINE